MIHEDEGPALELALEAPPLGLSRSPSEPSAPKTAVLDRKLRGLDVAAPTKAFNSGLLIGQYQLVGELGRAPTALLVEARDPENRPVILQIARLRPATSPIEKVERHYFEQRVAEATSLEAQDPELGLVAHGGADRPDGSRVLFWALPWRDEARELAKPGRRVHNARQLCDIGIALAHRLAKRHSYGRMDPLLSEHSILISGSGADLVGAPIFLSSEWLDPDMTPVRLAPEEAMNLIPRPTGDLWRLGTALEALALSFTEIPDTLKLCLQSFLRTDPNQRVLRATEAIVELEAVRAALIAEEGHLPIDPIVTANTAKLGALGPDAVDTLILNATADSTHLQATHIPHDVDTARTTVERAQAIIPDEPRAATADEHDTQVDTPADMQATEIGAPALKRRDDPPATRLFVHDHTPPMKVDETTSTVRDLPISAILSGTADTHVRPREPAREINLPQISSPTNSEVRAWSEISPALKRELTTPPPRMKIMLGTPAPAIAPLAPVAPVPPLSPLSPVVRSSSRADELDAEQRAAVGSPIVARAIIATLGVLALCGAGVFAYRFWPHPTEHVRVSHDDEVQLDVSPVGAMVIAELDGRMLGKTPMTFLVAPNVERAVMVYHEAFEPQRIMLPERGRVHIELRPIEKRDGCLVDLSAPRGAQLEAVGAQIGGPDHYAIRGSAVVRAKPGERAQGAWLVRCPPDGASNDIELKERQQSEQRTIELVSPQGVPVYADGVMTGSEAKIAGAFTELRMEIAGQSIERWLATDSDATVELTAQ